MARVEVAKQLGSHPQLATLDGSPDPAVAVRAIKRGAYDYVLKPIQFDELDALVTQAAKKAQLRRENVPFVVLERDPIRYQAALDDGMLVVEGDASREDVLVDVEETIKSPTPAMTPGVA